jgi:hypothetical protein
LLRDTLALIVKYRRWFFVEVNYESALGIGARFTLAFFDVGYFNRIEVVFSTYSLVSTLH